mmetsp:Transcript_53091/g.114046  ORF Transcript_53091/g.114046 Transcript_53091/m.114046 type:complete len:227 (-) Transcript_53091:572-1252(-)
MQDVCSAKDVNPAFQEPHHAVYSCATTELRGLHPELCLRMEWQILSWQEVREGDDRLFLPILCEITRQMLLVHLEEILPSLAMSVHWPTAHGVGIDVWVRSWIRPIKLCVIPRQEWNDENAIRHRSRPSIDSHLVTHLENGMELRYRIRVVACLYSKIVGANGIKYPAELRLQELEARDYGWHPRGQVAGDYQNVLLELFAVDARHPCPLPLTMVQVQVRHGEDPR